MITRSRVVLTAAVALAVAAPGCAGEGSAGPALHACRGARPARVDHVVWIWMENKTYRAVVGNDDAPFINKLAQACGLARRYSAITNPSLPNYIAATSGTLPRAPEKLGPILRDKPPSALGSERLIAASLYTQLAAHALSWRDYEDAMSRPCMLGNKGRYAARHNPALYYGRIASTECERSDVPLGSMTSGAFVYDLAHDVLPAFSFVTPDLCHDGHGSLFHCRARIESSDRWLRLWMPIIVRSKAYRRGHTVVFITWDEGKVSLSSRFVELVRPSERGDPCPVGSPAERCHVAMVVVSPSTRPCTVSDVPFNHYSLLKTTEELLGIGLIAHARDRATRSMSTAFRLVPERAPVNRRTGTACG